MKTLAGVHQHQLFLLLAAAMASAQPSDPSHNLVYERTSIERTYELTKYLEHQLKEIKDTYLSYLGPPFNEKDFSPPRPNSTALSLPSAATRLELWRGLENRARLAQNQRAYSVLLGAVRELARSTLCPYLQTSLLHFCTGLDGLLGSISGLMATLGYALPPASAEPQYPRREPEGDGGGGGRSSSRPAPLVSRGPYGSGPGTRAAGTPDGRRRMVPRAEEEKEAGEGGEKMAAAERRKAREGRRAEAQGGSARLGGGSREKGRGGGGRRGRRGEPKHWHWAVSEEEQVGEEERGVERDGVGERWGGGRKLLSVPEEEEGDGQRMAPAKTDLSVPLSATETNENNNNNKNNDDTDNDRHGNRYSYAALQPGQIPGGDFSPALPSSTSVYPLRRSPRSLLSATRHPPLSAPLAFFYPFESGEQRGTHSSLRRGTSSLLSPPLSPLLTSSWSSSSSSSSSLLSVQPALSDFSRKVEGFWILRELQSWLWRSAKDFNRLKKRLRG